MRPFQAHKPAVVSKFVVALLYSQMANANDLLDRLALGDAALDTAHGAAPQQKRMRFITKQSLVSTLSQNTPDPPETPFAFYVDTDDEKIAFIDLVLGALPVGRLPGLHRFRGARSLVAKEKGGYLLRGQLRSG